MSPEHLHFEIQAHWILICNGKIPTGGNIYYSLIYFFSYGDVIGQKYFSQNVTVGVITSHSTDMQPV